MNQQIAITEGVAVSVMPTFRADVSQVNQQIYYFNYRITIENRNTYPVQLIHRDWFIFDSLNVGNHVSGEGVVGQQPILEPGEMYEYTSGSEIHSEMGAMHGFYTFKNELTQEIFRVEIPMFQLVFPGKMN